MVVMVLDDFVILENSEGVMMMEIVVGDYVVVKVCVENYDFVMLWYQFFNFFLQDNKFQMVLKLCFECYFNDGNVDGYWDIEMFIVVEYKVGQFC